MAARTRQLRRLCQAAGGNGDAHFGSSAQAPVQGKRRITLEAPRSRSEAQAILAQAVFIGSDAGCRNFCSRVLRWYTDKCSAGRSDVAFVSALMAMSAECTGGTRCATLATAWTLAAAPLLATAATCSVPAWRNVAVNGAAARKTVGAGACANARRARPGKWRGCAIVRSRSRHC